MITDYIKGILYGDGYYREVDNCYYFSTTHKEISDFLIVCLDDLNVSYSKYVRENKKYEEWELLEIVEIKDKDFIIYLKSIGFTSDLVEDRILTSGDFLRGYLETKGTLFTFNQRSSIFWRCSFSGLQEDMVYLKDFLLTLGIETHEIVRRSERESLGIVSNSYRLNMQKRESISEIINYLYSEDEISKYLKEKMDCFIKYNNSTSFNQKKKVYKHYKNASLFMARSMGYTVGGDSNKSNPTGSGLKPIYLRDSAGNEEDVYKGWIGAYEGLSDLYESTGMEVPLVYSDD